jgi:hypothetical protein
MNLVSHLDSLEWVLNVAGIVRLSNAAAEPVRLVAPAGGLEFAFILFDPNVSHWTTRTPNTTATLSVSSC